MTRKLFLFAALWCAPLCAFAGGFSVSDAEEPIVSAALEVSPDRIVLGKTVDANVRVTLPETFSGRGECKNIQLLVNTGEIHDVTRIAPGVFTASYQLPEEFFPQFALITASAFCGGRTIVGATAHPLYGTGKVTVRSTPFSKVSLKIADDTFGPALTDGTGRADIPVVVRPGIFTGVAGGKEIDLDLPPLKRIVAFAVPPKLTTDDKDGALIWIYAIDDLGKPLASARFTKAALRGTLGPVESAAPGVFRVRYRPPASVGDGSDHVTVSLADDAVSQETLVFSLSSGRPAKITAEATPDRHLASSTEAVTVVARVFDEKGNPAAAELAATSNLGELSPLLSEVPGEYHWSLVLPSHFVGMRQAEVRIVDKSDEQLMSHAEVALVPDSKYAVEIDPPATPIPADGYTTVPIRIHVNDRYGNSVSGAPPSVRVSAGVASLAAEEADGTYTVRYTAPLKIPKQPARLAAQSGKLSADISPPLTNKIYRVAVAAEVGYFTNVGLIHAPMFSLVPQLSLWKVARGLQAGLDLGYYFSNADMPGQHFHSSFHALPMIIFGGYRFDLSSRWMIDLNAGIGPVTNIHVGTKTGEYVERQTFVKFGASVSAGGAMRAGPGHLTLRLRYLYTSKAEESITGRLAGLAVLLGYRFLI